jgi:hypothetical protein
MSHVGRRHLLVALAAVSASACTFAADRGIRGSGRIGTERRAVSGFERISIAGPFEVELHQGTQEGLELSGDDNLLALVDTRIEGTPGSANLKIAPKNDTSFAVTQPIRIRIDLIRLSALAIGGSGDITGKGLRVAGLAISIGGSGSVDLGGLEAERLAVTIGGSGHVGADGHARELALRIGGSGNGLFGRLVVDDARVEVAGSGNADVNVGRDLRVSIAGSGHVRHTGAAVPKASIAGSGSVQRG